MKRRDAVAILILVLAAILTVLRPWADEDGGGDFASGNGSDEGAGSSPSISSGAEVENSGRRTRSKRVIKKRPEKITTESGLQYEILTEGEGEHPGPTSTVKVHYVGTLEDGTVFDSSRGRGQPSEFPLNAVIKGWTEGLQLMKPGGVYRFVIPPELGYGADGAGNIPGDSTLTFEVELISIEKP